MKRTFPKWGRGKGRAYTTCKEIKTIKNTATVFGFIFKDITLFNSGSFSQEKKHIILNPLTNHQIHYSSYSNVWVILVYHCDHEPSLDSLNKC